MHLLAYPFRIFFLLTGLYGFILLPAWIGLLLLDGSLPVGSFPFQWHSHEMLYGLVPAAIAGFILTAITNWTGSSPLRGWSLLLLALLWSAGRLVLWIAALLPPWLVACVDLVFLPTVALYVGQVLWRSGNRRNFILVVVLLLLFTGNFMMHLGFINNDYAWFFRGQLLGFDVILLLMAIIAGRIIPAFSANWLRQVSKTPAKASPIVWWSGPWIDRLSIASLVMLLIASWLQFSEKIIGASALLAAALHGLRLANWGGWRVWREPLLWILHLAYLWIVIALLVRGLTVFYTSLPSTLWQHALGVGAIATLILGVMTRVCLGHTGRTLELPRFAVVIYYAITVAALTRVITAAGWINYEWGLNLSAFAWCLAFLTFVCTYTPIVCQPRVDGRQG